MRMSEALRLAYRNPRDFGLRLCRRFDSLELGLRKGLRALWHTLFGTVPLPVRLPYGAWWLADRDVFGDSIFLGRRDPNEVSFLTDFLTEGMIVFDLGAHAGFYTLLASRKVGAKGLVVAFEPSPREVRRLLQHIRINRCVNVRVEPVALGRSEGEGTMFLLEGYNTGSNSMRAPGPQYPGPRRTVTVPVRTLDGCLDRMGLDRLDFVKIDVEGAELDVFEGARTVLARVRPVIMCELYDSVTAAWGYPASAIYDYLACRRYQWFSIEQTGKLSPCLRKARYRQCNLVALPQESLGRLQRFLHVAR